VDICCVKQALAKWKTELNKKEQELLEFEVKLSNRESVCLLTLV
jgi:hypothetical protein